MKTKEELRNYLELELDEKLHEVKVGTQAYLKKEDVIALREAYDIATEIRVQLGTEIKRYKKENKIK